MSTRRPESPKTPNPELSEMRCPVALEDVDLFGAGAQEHSYEAYEILHRESPGIMLGTLELRLEFDAGPGGVRR